MLAGWFQTNTSNVSFLESLFPGQQVFAAPLKKQYTDFPPKEASKGNEPDQRSKLVTVCQLVIERKDQLPGSGTLSQHLSITTSYVLIVCLNSYPPLNKELKNG